MECVECGRAWDAAPRTGRPRRYCSRSCQGRAYRRRRDQGRLRGALHAAPVAAGSTTVTDVATALADAGGIEAVTLRSVAGRAGLPLRAVQRDFGSRDRLVALMAHHALAQHAHRLAPETDPIDALTRLAEAEWRAYRDHPWLVGVLASTRPPLVPAVLDAARAAIEVFTGLGLSADAARNRYLAFSAYIQGMGLLLSAEHLEAGSATSYRTWWSQELNRLDRTGATGRHPWLTDFSAAAPAEAFDADTAFRDGLQHVLQGLTTPPGPGTVSPCEPPPDPPSPRSR